MPLPLDDTRWHELQSSYGSTKDVIAWLAAACDGNLSDELIGDLINEVMHQGGTSSAMYAVATHLIELAKISPQKVALTLLTHAGIIYASSSAPRAVPCPSFLQKDFDDGACAGRDALTPLLPSATDFDSFKYAVAGLSGFIGHHSFGRLLMGLDLYKGQFHHCMLEAPIPLDL